MATSEAESIQHVLALFKQHQALEETPARSTEGGGMFDASRENVAGSIIEIIQRENLGDLFIARAAEAEAFDQTHADSTDDTPEGVLMGRVALAFLLEQPNDTPTKLPLPDILQGNVEDSAERLQGKRLAFADKVVTIAGTKGQTAEDNTKWINDGRPLFTDEPVGAYSPRTRGSHIMLFLRAGENGSCIRITSARDEQTGSSFTSSSQVCSFFGLKPEATYSVDYDGHTLTLNELPSAEAVSNEE